MKIETFSSSLLLHRLVLVGFIRNEAAKKKQRTEEEEKTWIIKHIETIDPKHIVRFTFVSIHIKPDAVN